MRRFSKIEFTRWVGLTIVLLIYVTIIAIALYTLLLPKIPAGVSKVFAILMCFVGACSLAGAMPAGILFLIDSIRYFNSKAYDYEYSMRSFFMKILWSMIYLMIGLCITCGAIYVIWSNYYHHF